MRSRTSPASPGSKNGGLENYHVDENSRGDNDDTQGRLRRFKMVLNGTIMTLMRAEREAFPHKNNEFSGKFQS